MVLRTSDDYDTVVKLSEECLHTLELEFIKNGHESITEFEITKPAYFRIVVEPNKLPHVHRTFILPTSIGPSKGATIDIHVGIESGPGELEHARDSARSFLRELVAALPKKPWIGIDGFARREEKKWKDILR